MVPSSNPNVPVRFGPFELDVRTGELRRDGTSLKLQPQPAKVLQLLVARAGEIVTRQDLAQQVWSSDTFVDFDQGLNYAIRQIRTALDDDAERPRYLETLPKRGYRFIAQIEDVKPKISADFQRVQLKFFHQRKRRRAPADPVAVDRSKRWGGSVGYRSMGLHCRRWFSVPWIGSRH